MRIPNISYRVKAARRRLDPAVSNWSTKPHLLHDDITFVCVGRNDDYAPDFERRLSFILEWNLRVCKEAVFVEWNPPNDRPLLSPALAARFDRLRCYVVPKSTHDRVCDNPNLPLMEYHAKNVGIRRASSDWVLASNADVLIGVDVMRTVENGLDPAALYTAQRVDVEGRTDVRPERLLRHPGYHLRVHPHAKLSTGDFLLAHKMLWEKSSGYDEGESRSRIGCDVRGCQQMMLLGARGERAGYVFHLDHATSCTNQIQAHHGERAATQEEPYSNPPNWGLSDCVERSVAPRVWEVG